MLTRLFELANETIDLSDHADRKNAKIMMGPNIIGISMRINTDNKDIANRTNPPNARDKRKVKLWYQFWSFVKHLFGEVKLIFRSYRAYWQDAYIIALKVDSDNTRASNATDIRFIRINNRTKLPITRLEIIRITLYSRFT